MRGLRTHTAHTVPLGAHTRRHATLSPDPRGSPVAQPQPTQAAPPSEKAFFSPPLPSPPPPKDVQNTPQNKPRLLAPPSPPPAAAPPFIFARRRVSPSPSVARPPLLPARRPPRTWTSLSIRWPPRSGSPRLRTDLARGGGGKRRRASERGRERASQRAKRERESREAEGVVTAFRSRDSCLSSGPAKGTLRLSMSQAARSQVPPRLQSPRRSRYASWTPGSPKFPPSRIKSALPQLSAKDGH